jgi:hypothetical protein
LPQYCYSQLSCELACFQNDIESAIRALARAVDSGFIDLGWLDHCPLLIGLRADPRFRSLRKIVAGRAAQVQEVLK